MNKAEFEQQAEHCRTQATAYIGKPESHVLLRIAQEFDRLATGDYASSSLPTPADKAGRGEVFLEGRGTIASATR